MLPVFSTLLLHFFLSFFYVPTSQKSLPLSHILSFLNVPAVLKFLNLFFTIFPAHFPVFFNLFVVAPLLFQCLCCFSFLFFFLKTFSPFPFYCSSSMCEYALFFLPPFLLFGDLSLCLYRSSFILSIRLVRSSFIWTLRLFQPLKCFSFAGSFLSSHITVFLQSSSFACSLSSLSCNSWSDLSVCTFRFSSSLSLWQYRCLFFFFYPIVSLHLVCSSSILSLRCSRSFNCLSFACSVCSMRLIRSSSIHSLRRYRCSACLSFSFSIHSLWRSRCSAFLSFSLSIHSLWRSRSSACLSFSCSIHSLRRSLSSAFLSFSCSIHSLWRSCCSAFLSFSCSIHSLRRSCCSSCLSLSCSILSTRLIRSSSNLSVWRSRCSWSADLCWSCWACSCSPLRRPDLAVLGRGVVSLEAAVVACWLDCWPWCCWCCCCWKWWYCCCCCCWKWR